MFDWKITKKIIFLLGRGVGEFIFLNFTAFCEIKVNAVFERVLEDRSYPYWPTELDIASHLGDLGMFYKALNAMFSQTVIKSRSHWVSRIHNRYCFVFLTTVYVVGNSLLRSQ